jgi:hypothetical protein
MHALTSLSRREASSLDFVDLRLQQMDAAWEYLLHSLDDVVNDVTFVSLHHV